MTSTPPPMPPTWQVTGQEQRTELGPTGQFVEGLRVNFTLGDGSPGYVFLPLAAATRDNVAAAIAERAAVMTDISNLSSEG